MNTDEWNLFVRELQLANLAYALSTGTVDIDRACLLFHNILVPSEIA